MSIISEDNRYSSVRKYTKPKLDTLPPVIEFSNYQNGQIVSANTIDVQVKVTDNITPSEQIIIE